MLEATQRETEATHKAKLALWDSRKKAFEGHLDGQEADALVIAKAIADAIPAFRRMLGRASRARSAHPNNKPPMGCVVLEQNALHQAVIAEFNRLWEKPQIGENIRFPGCTRLGHTYDPASFKPLVDKVRADADYALKTAVRPGVLG